MRTKSMIIIGAAAAALAACATNGGETYQQEYARLLSDSQERDGMLMPSYNPSSPRPATDYVCEIRGGGRLTAERADRD